MKRKRREDVANFLFGALAFIAGFMLVVFLLWMCTGCSYECFQLEYDVYQSGYVINTECRQWCTHHDRANWSVNGAYYKWTGRLCEEGANEGKNRSR